MQRMVSHSNAPGFMIADSGCNRWAGVFRKVSLSGFQSWFWRELSLRRAILEGWCVNGLPICLVIRWLVFRWLVFHWLRQPTLAANHDRVN